MSEREKQIIKTFAIIIPKLSECDKRYLLGLGEGMAIKVESQEKKSKEVLGGNIDFGRHYSIIQEGGAAGVWQIKKGDYSPFIYIIDFCFEVPLIFSFGLKHNPGNQVVKI